MCQPASALSSSDTRTDIDLKMFQLQGPWLYGVIEPVYRIVLNYASDQSKIVQRVRFNVYLTMVTFTLLSNAYIFGSFPFL